MATCSGVLLGVSDAPSKELHLSPYENKIGGYPVSGSYSESNHHRRIRGANTIIILCHNYSAHIHLLILLLLLTQQCMYCYVARCCSSSSPQDFFPSSSLPSAPHCCCCGEALVLVAQVYCPLEGSPYHRLIHIFCCSRQHCYERNSG